MGRLQQLPWHLSFARQNGVSDEEINELFTHLAFYAGWPTFLEEPRHGEDNYRIGYLAAEENLLPENAV